LGWRFGIAGAKGVGAVLNTAKGVLDLGESMSNAGQKALLAAGRFYLFTNAVEKGLSMKTMGTLLGENAEVLNNSASIFRDVAIKLWVVGEKIRGFWLGLMDRLAPVLSRLLDGTLTASLVQAGQAFGQKMGDAVAVVYQLAKDGELWSSFKAAFKLAFDYAGERMIWLANVAYDMLSKGFVLAVANGIADGLIEAGANLRTFMQDIGDTFANGILSAFSPVIDALNKFGEYLDRLAVKTGAMSSKTKEGRDRERENQSYVFRPQEGAGGVYPKNNPKEGSVSAMFAGIMDTNKFNPSDKLTEQIDAFSKAIGATLGKYQREESTSPTTTFENNTRRVTSGADSLSAIGGGGGVYLGLSVLDVNKRQLNVLMEINRKLGYPQNGGTPSAPAGNAPAGGVSRTQTESPVN